MSGSFRTDYHIDFTGSTTGTADSSSGYALLIIWRTRRHHAEDNATTRAMSGGRMPRNTRSLLMTNEREFWRNVRGDRDNGTDSDFIPLSLLWRDGPHGHPHPGAPQERESSDSGIDSEELSPSLPTRSFKLCLCRIDSFCRCNGPARVDSLQKGERICRCTPAVLLCHLAVMDVL